MLEGFSKYYDIMTPEDKKTLLFSMISYIEINKERKPHGQLLRKIHFTFPVTYDGESGVLFVSSNDGTVETVCSLVLRNAPVHIDIDVDVEELVQSKRGQATHTQIKQYVSEHTGLNVSTLYISQIKRKYGLEVSESYNKPKSEDTRVPQCPPEKEAAIVEAMKYYGIIDDSSSDSR